MKNLKKSLEDYKKYGNKQHKAFCEISDIISIDLLQKNKVAYWKFIDFVSGLCDVDDLLNTFKANKIIIE